MSPLEACGGANGIGTANAELGVGAARPGAEQENDGEKDSFWGQNSRCGLRPTLAYAQAQAKAKICQSQWTPTWKCLCQLAMPLKPGAVPVPAECTVEEHASADQLSAINFGQPSVCPSTQPLPIDVGR